MAVNDQRDFVTFYGIVFHHDDWKTTFGKFTNHREILVTDYIGIDCNTYDSTQANSACSDSWCATLQFLFPHHIKKQYYIEGVIEGEFTVSCYNGNSDITDYRISIWKTNEDLTYERLAVTYLNGSEWIPVDGTLTWDAGNSIGEEKVYHWYIDCWDAQELKEKDRLYLQIEIRGSNNKLYLMHANDPDWTDIWCKIPFRL